MAAGGFGERPGGVLVDGFGGAQCACGRPQGPFQNFGNVEGTGPVGRDDPFQMAGLPVGRRTGNPAALPDMADPRSDPLRDGARGQEETHAVGLAVPQSGPGDA